MLQLDNLYKDNLSCLLDKIFCRICQKTEHPSIMLIKPVRFLDYFYYIYHNEMWNLNAANT